MLNALYAQYLNDADVENALIEVARRIFGNPFSFYLEPKDDGFKFRKNVKNIKNGLSEFINDNIFIQYMMEDNSCPTLQQYVTDHYPKSCFSIRWDMERLFTKSCRFLIDLESDTMARMIRGEYIENPLQSVFKLTDSSVLLKSVRTWPEKGVSSQPILCKGEIMMPFLGTAHFSSISFNKINADAAEHNGLKHDQFLEVVVNLRDEDQAIITMVLNYLKKD